MPSVKIRYNTLQKHKLAGSRPDLLRLAIGSLKKLGSFKPSNAKKSLFYRGKSVFSKKSRLKTFSKLKTFLKSPRSFKSTYLTPTNLMSKHSAYNKKTSLIQSRNSIVSAELGVFALLTSRQLVSSNIFLSRSLLSYNNNLSNLVVRFFKFNFFNKNLKYYSLQADITPWIEKTVNSFISSVTGMRSLIQFYPFLSSEIDSTSAALYRNWLPRLSYYQKRLGHRFFMEETLHIMHLSLKLHDATFFSSWLTSLINRISFWKTRSIFRYLLYLFKNFFLNEFSSIGCKGLKIRLKGKISAAGNSRKRRINFKFGKVSYSTLKNKCLSKDSLISTFTGVMCLRTEIFY